MAVLSSTQNTAACAGGFRYRPMMSVDRLLLKVRIVRGYVALDPMGLQSMLA
jgi:hypothetical protein